MRMIVQWFNVSIFLVLLLAASGAQAEDDPILKLYNAGKYEEAFAYYQDLAEIGMAHAQYIIGVMYYKGQSVAKDPVQAYAWMKLAIDKLQNETYTKATELILSSLPESERKLAEDKAAELRARLGEEALKKTIYPKPLSDEECTQDAVPISRKNPEYPAKELSKWQMGIVEAEFTISPQGHVRDLITVRYTTPEFAKATIKAASRWRYSPRIAENQAVPAYGRRILFAYQFDVRSGKSNKSQIRKSLQATREKAIVGDPVEQFKYALMLNDYNMFKSFLKGINLEYQEANKWYLSSAIAGLTNAQFMLGRIMMKGQGCEVDETGGRKWINAAAARGFSPAQRFLAQDLIGNSDQRNYRAAMKWLESSVVFGDYYPSKVMLAWEYATSYMDEYRNGARALELLRGEPGDYHDQVRIVETEAAAYAENGDFATAVKKQQQAIQAAKNLDWDIPEMQSRLTSYEAGKPWRGAYFVPVPQAASDTVTDL